MNAVFHASTEKPGVLRNVGNLLDDETLELEAVALVAHGGGLDLVVKTGDHAEQVGELLERGVDVAACANTMRNNGLDETDLVDGVRGVSSGVGELTRLQHRGFAYLRP